MSVFSPHASGRTNDSETRDERDAHKTRHSLDSPRGQSDDGSAHKRVRCDGVRSL
jgi:hypothetical protein